jgi:hypothetical protein
MVAGEDCFHVQETLINSIFQPDSLATAQFEDTIHRATPLEPEKKLLLAVLEDAVMCFQDNLFARERKKRQLFEETEEWIFTERSERLFAFEGLCHSLNLDPHYIRHGLRQWQESRLNRPTRLAFKGPKTKKSTPIKAKSASSKVSRPKTFRRRPSPSRNLPHTMFSRLRT